MDSGILGPVDRPDNLTMTVSVGHSLFDARYGLASLAPKKLQKMTRFPNDSLDAAPLSRRSAATDLRQHPRIR
ncbi:Deferrochelatase/peroxidase EfeB precursor [Raoultella terrigena]|uniref:Deferrochelatase/peroxidase EfeB n=1 Tax=Raoultella terrigena TaxID=577 RepID=A0A4U9DAD7_RAOTE|nr:Deferrochelatase/peroxidase EfeB precursor [Raoultella terrigena]